MMDANQVGTPIEPKSLGGIGRCSGEPRPRPTGRNDKRRYAEAVGLIVWMATMTRPDLAFAAGFLAAIHVGAYGPALGRGEKGRYGTYEAPRGMGMALDQGINIRHGRSSYTTRTKGCSSAPPRRHRLLLLLRPGLPTAAARPGAAGRLRRGRRCLRQQAAGAAGAPPPPSRVVVVNGRRIVVTDADIASVRRRKRNTILLYSLSVVVTFVGLSFAAVPLYRVFCARNGLGSALQGAGEAAGGTRFTEDDFVPVVGADRVKVIFNADRSLSLPWDFAANQSEVNVLPGETALAFFTATNRSTRDIIGVSTYNITPGKAAIYFNKIQCFCFEEQILRAGEQVDMPVFFFIDPAFAADPKMSDVRQIILSYTFFKSRNQEDRDKAAEREAEREEERAQAANA
ncbi:MAG: cytochrome c oxidase assembly protein CtaG/Cox11-domain-containing protein [Olpidium bornovanus]|uniref:Cytochrome c oxidase assembly protein CtaG/Cox11-domain-containing protein n=1 Tax=Olpidium bornovanus TaxID=278681 RepID=A0A8H7ZW84_9FUNG|nr:MAG: cytochrome c oxidase assembly protein CtaG/Cox11-domain-containing protein [Olpidium bornovanus]